MFHLIPYSTILPTCYKRFYSFFKGICISCQKKFIECIFNIYLIIEFILSREKCCKCLNKWKSVSAKSGEYGGRISYNRYLTFFRIIFEECGRALSCTSRTPCLFNNAGCGSESFSCICWIPAKWFTALIVSPGLRPANCQHNSFWRRACFSERSRALSYFNHCTERFQLLNTIHFHWSRFCIKTDPSYCVQ